MTRAEMNRRLATMTADQVRLARRMLKGGHSPRDIAAKTDITLKQANAVAEWMDRYPPIIPAPTTAKSEAPRSAPLTNADINPGDIVRLYDKEWRVQGIDDLAPNFGLLLLDVAEPEDDPYFVTTDFPISRGSRRRPPNGTGHRWCWGRAESAELVSRGEPE